MYAIRSHRHAAGDFVDDQAFEHQRWTLVETLTPTLEAAMQPEPGHTQPRLAVLQVADADDPLLLGSPIVGQEPALSGSDSEEDIDLDQASLPALKKLAKLLGINRSQGRGDLIAAIREKHAALDQAETQPAETDEDYAA